MHFKNIAWIMTIQDILKVGRWFNTWFEQLRCKIYTNVKACVKRKLTSWSRFSLLTFLNRYKVSGINETSIYFIHAFTILYINYTYFILKVRINILNKLCLRKHCYDLKWIESIFPLPKKTNVFMLVSLNMSINFYKLKIHINIPLKQYRINL